MTTPGLFRIPPTFQVLNTVRDRFQHGVCMFVCMYVCVSVWSECLSVCVCVWYGCVC